MLFASGFKKTIIFALLLAFFSTQIFGEKFFNEISYAANIKEAKKEEALYVLLVEEGLWLDNEKYTGLSEENSKVYPLTLAGRISRYAESIQSSLPFTKTAIILVSANEEPQKIMTALEKIYREGFGENADKSFLRGVVLIGDLPVPVVKKSGNSYPSLYPYIDFDDKLFSFDSGKNEFVVNNIKNPQPEVVIGVIKPPKNGEDGKKMLAEYFDKNYLFRLNDENYGKFDQKIFYGDLIRETQSLNKEAFSKYQNLLKLGEEKTYLNYSKNLAKKLYDEAVNTFFGTGDKKDNDNDGKIDEDPINGFDDDGEGEEGSPLHGIVDGLDNDKDGEIDEADEGYYGICEGKFGFCGEENLKSKEITYYKVKAGSKYKVADSKDNNGNGIQDEGIDEDDGDFYLNVDNDRDGQIDEDGDEDNDADKDKRIDEDPKGDLNNDGCPGSCLVDEDGDAVDSDGDFFPDGDEKANSTDPFDPADYPSAGNFMGMKIPNFNPAPDRDNPNYPQAKRKFYFDKWPDKKEKSCLDQGGKFHPEWDDDEDGKCDEDSTKDNDNDRDGQTDEDKSKIKNEIDNDTFAKLPDIRSQQIIDQYLGEYPSLLSKYLGELNKFVSYSGRWKKEGKNNLEDFSSLIGKRDGAMRMYFLVANTALEKAIDELATEAQSKFPVVLSARIKDTEIIIEENGTKNAYNFSPQIEFWQGNDWKINGIQYFALKDALECSLFRGTSSKVESKSKLVLFNKVYNPIPPKDSEGKFIEEDGPKYGYCVGKFFENPEICLPEKAEEPILDYAGAKSEPANENWLQSSTDFRSCFALKEKKHFEDFISDKDGELIIGGRKVKYLGRYQKLVDLYYTRKKEMAECLKDKKDASKCTHIKLTSLPKEENKPQFYDKYKDLNQIVVFKKQVGNENLVITLADIALSLNFGDKDYFSLNEYLFNPGEALQTGKQIVLKNPFPKKPEIKELKIYIDNLTFAKDGPPMMPSRPLLLSSLVKHKSPFSFEGKEQSTTEAYDSDWVLYAQSQSQISSDLPIDNPRYLTFKDKNGNLQKINYPNFFKAKSAEEALLQTKTVATKLAALITDDEDKKNQYIGKVMQVFSDLAISENKNELKKEAQKIIADFSKKEGFKKEAEKALKERAELLIGNLAENIYWRDLNIDEKHQYIAKIHLSVKDDLKKKVAFGRENKNESLKIEDALEKRRKEIFNNIPFMAEKGYEAAYLIFTGSKSELNYAINPEKPEKDEDQAIKFPKTEKKNEISSTENKKEEEVEPIFLFYWFDHIIKWLASLDFRPQASLKCQFSKSDLENVAKETGDKESEAKKKEREFKAEEMPKDKDGNGIPDEQDKVKSLKIEAEKSIILAEGKEQNLLRVNVLDKDGNILDKDGFSEIRLNIVKGAETINLLSENEKRMAGGRAEFVISSTDKVGEASFKAETLNLKQNIESNEIRVRTTDKMLKISSYEKLEKKDVKQEGQEIELEDLLILTNDDKKIARIKAQTGQVEILDNDYEVTGESSKEVLAARLVIKNKTQKNNVAAVFFVPQKTVILKTNKEFLLGEDFDYGVNYKLLAGAKYYQVEEGEEKIKITQQERKVAEINKFGQIFLSADFALNPKKTTSQNELQTFIIIDAEKRPIAEVFIAVDMEKIKLVTQENEILRLISQKEPIFAFKIAKTEIQEGEKLEDKKNYRPFFSLGFENSLAASKKIDRDNDGLSDLEEFIIGTDATLADTDGDFISDNEEVLKNNDPRKKDEKLFTDLDSDNKYFPSIIELYKKGILKGYVDRTFKADNPIRREEFMKVDMALLCVDCTRFSETRKNEIWQNYEKEKFSDTDIQPELKYCVADGKNQNIISGYKGGADEGYFRPSRLISRAEAIKVVLNTAAIEIPKNSLEGKPWYYNHLIAAKQADILEKGKFSEVDSSDIDGFKSYLSKQIETNGEFISYLNEPISRGEFALMTNKILQIKNCYELDEDNDGLSDQSEYLQYSTNPKNADTDLGGVNDYIEIINRMNPLDKNDDSEYLEKNQDKDKDGLSDFEEKILGTDPANPDTDFGGINDYLEVKEYKTDPLNKNDDLKIDSDGDLLPDAEEKKSGTDPKKADTDEGGVNDFEEVTFYKTDPLNKADDNLQGVYDFESGFHLAAYKAIKEKMTLPTTEEVETFGEEIAFKEELPADGKSTLFLRAELQNINGETLYGEHGKQIRFQEIDDSSKYAQITKNETVKLVDGKVETQITAKKKAGEYIVKAELLGDDLPKSTHTINIYSLSPQKIVFASEQEKIKADNLSSLEVMLNLYDENNNLATNDFYRVNLKIEGPGEFEGLADLDSEKKGMDIDIFNGQKNFVIKSTKNEGPISVKATYLDKNTNKEITGNFSLESVNNLSLLLQPINGEIIADGLSKTVITISALQNNQAALMNGEVNLEIQPASMGKLSQDKVKLDRGQASVVFSANKIAGKVKIIARGALFETKETEIVLKGKKDAAKLKVYAEESNFAADAGNKIKIIADIFDENDNKMTDYADGEVKVRVSEATKKFISSLGTGKAEIKGGRAEFLVSPSNITGPINLIFSHKNLPETVLKLESINKLTGKDFRENPPNILHISLLGTDAGNIFTENYLGGEMLFNRGKSQAITTLITEPTNYEKVFSLSSKGKIEISEQGNFVETIELSQNHSPEILLIDSETNNVKAKIYAVLPEKAVLGMNEKEANKNHLNLELKNSDLRQEKTEERIAVADTEKILFTILKNGAIEIFDSEISLKPKLDEKFAFEIISAKAGSLATVNYNFAESEKIILAELGEKNPKPGLIFELAENLAPLKIQKIFNENSTAKTSSYVLFDTRYKRLGGENPGIAALSLEDSAKESNVGFKEGNKHILLFAAGNTVGESNKPYFSDIGIILGDPTISVKTANDISRTGFTKDIGMQILASEEEIQSITSLDYDNDGLEDIFVAYGNGKIRLLKNSISYRNFKDADIILNLVNGIKLIEKGDLNGDNQTDLLILTENSCKKGEICLYAYLNDNGSFSAKNLNLEISADLTDFKLADLNRDNFPDLVAVDQNNQLKVFYNNKGNFEKKGEILDNLNFSVDEKENLIRSVLVHYDLMSKRDENDPATALNYRDLLILTENKNKNSDLNSLLKKNNLLKSERITYQTNPIEEEVQTQFIFADTDQDLIFSTKKVVDLNGPPLKIGDRVKYTLTLNNAGKTKKENILISDSLSPSFELASSSLSCKNCQQKEMKILRSVDRSRPILVALPLLDALAQKTIEYEATYNGEAPIYKILVANNIDEIYPKDEYLDIMVSPENNPANQVIYYYSAGIRGDGKIDFKKQLSIPQKSKNLPMNIPFFKDGKVDLGEVTKDGVPKEVMTQFNDLVAADKDKDLLPNIFDFKDGNLKVDLSKITDELNKGLGAVADNLDKVLKELTCGGSCLPFPVSISWLSMGSYNVMGIPAGFDPGTPIFGDNLGFVVPPYVCMGPQCVSSLYLRTYLSPTVPPANLGLALCLGPYAAGQCFAFSFDLLKALNLCEVINSAISEALSGVNNVISTVSNTLVFMGKGKSGNNAKTRDDASGLVNVNLGSYEVKTPGKSNYRVPGFPKPITEWFEKQLDEVIDKLTDLPDIYIILPDIVQAFKPQAKFETPKNIRDIITWLNSIPILEIETQKVSFKVPIVGKEEIARFEYDVENWVKDLKDQMKLNAARMNPRLKMDIEALIAQVEYNISTLQDYKKIFKKIRDFRVIQSKYIGQIICYIDAIHEMLVGWIKKNELKVRAWIKAIDETKRKFTDWKLLIDVPLSYQESCDKCTTDRFTLYELIAKLFIFVPTPPIIMLPKWPDIVMDFSEIEAGLTIVWPEIDFQPIPITLPKLPRLDLASPKLNLQFSLGKELPNLPLLPALPAFPELPNLPPLPMITLPTLPDPPDIPGLHPSLKIALQGLKVGFKILCLLKSNLIPTPEIMLKSKFENLAARNLDAILPIDTGIRFNIPNITYEYVDRIELKGKMNFAANFKVSALYNAVKELSSHWNKFVESNVGLLNQKLSEFSNLMQGIMDAPLNQLREGMRNSIDIDLNKLFYKPEAKGEEMMVSEIKSAFENISKIAVNLNQNYKKAPEKIVSKGKILSYLPSTHPSLNKDLKGLRFIAKENNSSDNLINIRNELLAYANNLSSFDEQKSETVEKFIADYNAENKKIAASLNRFLAAENTDSLDKKDNIYKFDLKDQSQKLAADFRNSLAAETKTQTPENSSPSFDFTPEIKGIMVYNKDLNVNERLIDYLEEIEKKSQILSMDYDKDGDMDLIYSYGGDIYLKDNYLFKPKREYINYSPEIKPFSALIGANKPSLNLNVADIGNQNITLEWTGEKNVRSYEINIFDQLEEIDRSNATKIIELAKFSALKNTEPKAQKSEFSISEIEGEIFLSGGKRLRLESGSAAIKVFEGDIAHAITDSIITLEGDENKKIELKKDSFLPLSSAYFDKEATLKAEGSIVLIRPSLIENNQPMQERDILLPEDFILVGKGNSFILNFFNTQKRLIKGKSEVSIKDLIDPLKPSLKITLPNNNYFADVKGIDDKGNLTNSSQLALLSPQNCSDISPPLPNIGYSEKEVPLYGFLTLDAGNSFDADSKITAYYWDLDLDKDSNNDGIFDNDPDYSNDLDKNVDSNFDGILGNDASDPVLMLGPMTEIKEQKIALNVLDEQNNRGKEIVTIKVVIPKINLESKDNFFIGKVTPNSANIPITLFRKRGDEPWKQVVAKSANKEGQYLTDKEGNYSIEGFMNEEKMAILDGKKDEIARINLENGMIDLINQNYQIVVRPAENKKATRIEVIDKAGKTISTVYLVVDGNNDVSLVNENFVFDKDLNGGVYVKILNSTYSANQIQGSDFLYGGGVMIEKNNILQSRILPNGDIYLYIKDLELKLKKSQNKDEGVTLFMEVKGEKIAEIYYNTLLSSQVKFSSLTGNFEKAPNYEKRKLSAISDFDGDGMPDIFEINNNLNYLSYSDRDLDADNDGLSNYEEYLNGTNPNKSDTDGDFISDKEEIEKGKNPRKKEIKSFSDVPQDSSLFAVTEKLKHYGIIEGYKENNEVYYRGDKEISRAEYTKIMLKLLCIEPRKEAKVMPQPFADVILKGEENPWYFDEIKEALLRKLITGYLNTFEALTKLPYFKPDQNINLAEGVKIILEALDKEGIITLSQVKIAENEAWYIPYLKIAKDLQNYLVDKNAKLTQNYIITEKEAENPGKMLTRAEFATIVSRALTMHNCYEIDANKNEIPDYWEKNNEISDINGDNDGDGLNNGLEYKLSSNPNEADTDFGGVKDGDEYLMGMNLLDSEDDIDADPDQDGLKTRDEKLIYKTDPNKADTDGGGLLDGEEIRGGKNPLFAKDDLDTDLDGLLDKEEIKFYLTDPKNPDTDFGGIDDGIEIARKSDPLDKEDDLKDPRQNLAKGVNFTLPECKTCPCDVAIENMADLLEKDQVMTGIYDPKTKKIHAVSNIIEIKR